MNNINNKKTEVPCGKCLNDKDYITILLTLLKDMEKNMTVALTEASNEKLYKHYKKMFDSYAELQRSCYEISFKNGWYKLEEVPKTKVTNLSKMLNNELENLK